MLGSQTQPSIQQRRPEEDNLLDQLGGLLGGIVGGAGEIAGGAAKGLGDFAQENPELAGILTGALLGGPAGFLGAGAAGGLLQGAQFRRSTEAAEISQQRRALEAVQKQQEAIRKQQAELKKVTAAGEDKLRTEFIQPLKKFDDALAAQNKLESSIKKGTAIGDLAAIIAFMKVVDPGSTVREGEVATVENARGWGSARRAQYNRLVNGEKLTTTQRRELLEASRGNFQAEADVFNRSVSDKSKIAQRRGLNFRNIVTERKVNFQPLDEISFDDKKVKKGPTPLEQSFGTGVKKLRFSGGKLRRVNND